MSISDFISPGDVAALAATVNDFSNAVLTSISPPGAPDAYGETTAGSPAWTGAAPAFLAREQHDIVSGGAQVRVQADTLTMTGLAAPVVEAAGPDWSASTITVTDNRQATPVDLVFTVSGMEVVAVGLIDSVILTLDEVGE